MSVKSRTSPGYNSPGGPGRITAVHHDTCSYDVKYIMGGREKGVDQSFVTVSNLLGFTTSRRESAIQGDSNRKRIEKTHGEQLTPEPKARRVAGEGVTPAPMRPHDSATVNARSSSSSSPSATATAAPSPSPSVAPHATVTSGSAASLPPPKRARWQASGHRWLRRRVRVARQNDPKHMDDGRVVAWLPGTGGVGGSGASERWRVQLDGARGTSTIELREAAMRVALKAWSERAPPGTTKSSATSKRVPGGSTSGAPPSKRAKGATSRASKAGGNKGKRDGSKGARSRNRAKADEAATATQVSYAPLAKSPHTLAPMDDAQTTWVDGAVAQPTGASLVGKRVAVLWQEHGAFYEAELQSYDADKGSHHLRFHIDGYECDWVLSQHLWFLATKPGSGTNSDVMASSKRGRTSSGKSHRGGGRRSKANAFAATAHPDAHFVAVCRAPDGSLSIGHFGGRAPDWAGQDKEKANEQQVVKWVARQQQLDDLAKQRSQKEFTAAGISRPPPMPPPPDAEEMGPGPPSEMVMSMDGDGEGQED